MSASPYRRVPPGVRDGSTRPIAERAKPRKVQVTRGESTASEEINA